MHFIGRVVEQEEKQTDLSAGLDEIIPLGAEQRFRQVELVVGLLRLRECLLLLVRLEKRRMDPEFLRIRLIVDGELDSLSNLRVGFKILRLHGLEAADLTLLVVGHCSILSKKSVFLSAREEGKIPHR